MSVYSAIAYITFCISGIFIIISERKALRSKGWLLMIAVLLVSAMPYQIYSIFANSMLSIAIFQDGLRDFSSNIIQDYFLAFFKNTKLQIWGSLSILAHFTAIIIAILKPLNGIPKLETENDETP